MGNKTNNNINNEFVLETIEKQYENLDTDIVKLIEIIIDKFNIDKIYPTYNLIIDFSIEHTSYNNWYDVTLTLNIFDESQKDKDIFNVEIVVSDSTQSLATHLAYNFLYNFDFNRWMN